MSRLLCLHPYLYFYNLRQTDKQSTTSTGKGTNGGSGTWCGSHKVALSIPERHA